MDRRTYLAGVAAGVGALAGCLGADAGPTGGPGPPTATRRLPMADDAATLDERTVSGGPGKDGIPAIDEPQFVAAVDATLAPGAVVFGVALGGEARAYPQSILVWHEVVNDRVGGRPVSVTYCPLTGTALGFDRGETTFGVSGDLVNSNLVMYDRATDSRWPQMLATAITGTLEGDSLREVPVVWTTWDRWRSAHPDTRLLSEETGFVRNYDDDPYGEYDPASGYYANDRTLFAPLRDDDRFPPKEPFVVAREPTADGADAVVAVHKATLRERGVVPAGRFLAVYDPSLDTGYLYRLEDTAPDAYAWADGEVTGPTGTHRPDALPLERATAFDAMWFAWVGFYPETEVYGP